MLKKILPVVIAILAIVIVAYLCMDKARVKKEMCINADVMDEENFGKQVECD